MNYFSEPIRVEISKELSRKAWDFANAVVHTTDYSDAHQSNKKDVVYDHYASKLGEEAVRSVFERYNCQVSPPDYTIYSKDEKSWDHDLYVNGMGLAVKSQSVEALLKHSKSWLFSKGARRTDPILNQPESWIAFTHCDGRTSGAASCLVYPVRQIKTLSFEPPELPHLKDTKTVVYLRSTFPQFDGWVPLCTDDNYYIFDMFGIPSGVTGTTGYQGGESMANSYAR